LHTAQATGGEDREDTAHRKYELIMKTPHHLK